MATACSLPYDATQWERTKYTLPADGKVRRQSINQSIDVQGATTANGARKGNSSTTAANAAKKGEAIDQSGMTAKGVRSLVRR